MRTLTEMLARCTVQARSTPIITQDQMLMWMREAIQRVCNHSQALQRWTLILCKAQAARYLLPGDHQWTLAAYYNEQLLGRCTSMDAQQVPSGETSYYHEDDWQDASSEAVSTEMMTQWTLLGDLVLLQLAHGQCDAGRKTLTLVSAPTADGNACSFGQSYNGFLDGTLTAEQVQEAFEAGLVFDALTTEGNLWLWYKYRDQLPVETTDQISYNDILAVLYMCGTLELALTTEDDEYDRYRSWLYGELARQGASALRRLSINGGVR